MKIRIQPFLAAAVATVLWAAAPVQSHAYDNMTLGTTEIELINDYNFPEILPLPTISGAADGFLHGMMVINGDIYVPYLPYLPEPNITKITLKRYRFSDGTFNEADVTVAAAPGTESIAKAHIFVGNDSQGNPFACSPAGYYNSTTARPMTIYNCNPQENILELTEIMTFPVWKDNSSRDVSIAGDITSGTFSAAAIGWPNTKHTTWPWLDYGQIVNLGLWNVQQGEVKESCTMKFKFDENNAGLFAPTVQALGDVYLLVDERGNYDDSALKYEIPTVIQYEGYKKTVSSLQQSTPPRANGSHIFRFGSIWMIVYPSADANGNQTYTIAYLPEYPYKIENIEPLWTLAEEFPKPVTADAYDDIQASINNNFITFIPEQSGQGSLYIQTLNQGLAKYTIKEHNKVPTSAPQINADSAPAEYFTLTGLSASEPLAPGVYIRRTGSQCRLIYVR